MKYLKTIPMNCGCFCPRVLLLAVKLNVTIRYLIPLLRLSCVALPN